MKFFLNENAESYLRNLESEFGDSTNGIRLELNKFEDAGMLKSEFKGNKKFFKANINHPLFPEIHNILLKHIGIDQILDQVINNIGALNKVFLVGDFAKGKDSTIIDLVFVGDQINKTYLLKIINKAEKIINRKIRYLLYPCDEIGAFLQEKNGMEYILLWSNEA
jgi:hypothetical protein